jgi:hypothetical protein
MPSEVGSFFVYIPSSTTNLREGELDTPDFTLVSETVFTDEFQFGIPEIAGSVT